MRTVTYRLADLEKKVSIHIGRLGENEVTRVQIDAGSLFAEYPDAVASMSVENPEGVKYPATVTRDGDMVIWDVRDSDLAKAGHGEIQWTFTENGAILKSAIARTSIGRSIVGDGTPPDPLEDWIEHAEDLLEQVDGAFPKGGSAGQVLAKKSGADYDTEWVNQGSGGTGDYEDLENLPKIGGVELKGDKSLHDLGAAAETDIPDVSGFYTKPGSGIPASDLADGVIPDVSGFYTKPGSGIPASDLADGVIPDVSGFYTKPSGGIPASDLADGVIPDPEDLIDDTAGAGDTEKVWSADKSSSLLSALSGMNTATASDVGKALSPKTVADGKVTEWQFKSVSGGGGGSDIDDTAGAGDTDKAWSADKLTTKFGVIENLTTQKQTGLITSFKQGSASEDTGVVDETDTARCYSGILNMQKGDTYTFSRSVNKIATTSYLAVYDSTGTFLNGRSVPNGTTITFDNDGKFAITCVLNTVVAATMEEAISAANGSFNATFDNTIKLVEVVNAHGAEISGINSVLGKMNGTKLTKSDLNVGAYYAVSNGKVTKTTSAGALYSDLIDVSAYKGARMLLYMDTRRSGSSRAFGFCDSEGNVGNYAYETNCTQVADGGYYKVLLCDEDYMFFSASGDQTLVDIQIVDSSELLTVGRYDKEEHTKRYYHMSFDDVILCLQDITTNASTYNSIFDNSLFGWCKSMHDLYGTTFSLYVYFSNAAETWTLENCTAAFADEFAANSDWLKFGLHAYNENVNYETSESRAADDYADAIAELVRITGSANCIDRVPRLHGYQGTLTALKDMRDCDLGCVGFIASADTDLVTPRDSYYFDSDENAYIYKHVYMHDSENHLHFVKTSYLWSSGSPTITIPEIENTPLYFNRNKYVEIFTHENQLTSGTKEMFETKFLQLSYSHLPYYLMDLVLTS